MLSRVRRQPRHAAKRSPRRHRHVPVRLPRPQVHVPRPHLHVPRPHLHLPRPHVPHPRLRMPRSPVRSVVGFVSRWRGGRADAVARAPAGPLPGASGPGRWPSSCCSPASPSAVCCRSALRISGTAHEISTVQAENDALGATGLGAVGPRHHQRSRPPRLRVRAQGPARLRHPALAEPVGLGLGRLGPGPPGRTSGGARFGPVPGAHRGGRRRPGHARHPVPPPAPATATAGTLADDQLDAARAPQLLGAGGPQPGVLELTRPRRPLGESDRDAVARLLGRRPAGAFTVVVRRRDGAPAVIENAPLLDDGRPMPTRFWLVDAAVRDAVSRLEAAGGVRARRGRRRPRRARRGPRPVTRPSATGPCRPATAARAPREAWGGPARGEVPACPSGLVPGRGGRPGGALDVAELGLDATDFVVERRPRGRGAGR